MEMMFPKYVPQKIIGEYIDKSDDTMLEGKKIYATIFFLDLANFTTKSEEMEARLIVQFLNQLFEEIVPIIEKHDGIIDKFTGDGLMALFGVPISSRNDPNIDAANAVLSSVKVVEKIKDFNKERNLSEEESVHVRIGINTGNVVAGNVGYHSRVNYTVIGDPVNIASRLEGAGKGYIKNDIGCIIIGENTFKAVNNNLQNLLDFELLGPQKIKGKREPIIAYKINF